MNIDKITIPDRHRKDMGDVAALAASIKKQGLLQPIGLLLDNTLVFGERRLRACRDVLGWKEIEAKYVNVTSLLEAERDENEVRKDFTASERVAIKQAIEAEIGDRRGSNQYKQKEDVENFPQAQGQKTREISAKAAGFGNETTARQAEKVVDTEIPELIEAMDSGIVSISDAAAIAFLPVETVKAAVAKVASGEAKTLKAATHTPEESEEPEPYKPTLTKKQVEALPRARGMWQAERAIRELEYIDANDIERQQAFDHVKGWIQEHERKA